MAKGLKKIRTQMQLVKETEELLDHFRKKRFEIQFSVSFASSEEVICGSKAWLERQKSLFSLLKSVYVKSICENIALWLSKSTMEALLFVWAWITGKA